ncbi:heparinase II/III family protein [Sphaerisporangium perillae]|uniref:heparinase II/III family protein n=1 Tax=Sphaerisporangium perillae TaxID=2935860 RepID=UPI00200BB57E|nr:heparinase II/III family protein [Sphaerisporangium perillae]
MTQQDQPSSRGRRSRIWAPLAQLVLLVAIIVACVIKLTQPATPSLAASANGVKCRVDQSAAVGAADVMKGRLALAGLPAFSIGKDIDWHLDPYRNRSWALDFHSLRWIGNLILAYETTRRQDYLDRAVAIAEDWVHDNPRGASGTDEWAWAEHAIALRAPVLVCLSKYVKAGWLAGGLAEHAAALADPALYKQGHNHGLDQDIALLSIACRLHDEGWKDLALRRMTASGRIAIDKQGVLQEQAPRYGLYVHERLGIVMTMIKDCRTAVPDDLVARRRALETYIAHATQPDGRMVPLGDSPADLRPKGYPHEAATVKVFGGGYVFGRTAWDSEDAAYYSIRFGPGRRFHGHEDHMGVTYHAQRRDILVEAGFHSYEKTPYQFWTTSAEAHNVPVVAGARFRPGTPTTLAGRSIGATRQSYRLTDQAYGVVRGRSVLVNHGKDLMAVLDTAPAGSRVSPIWHFSPSLEVLSDKDGRVVLGTGTGTGDEGGSGDGSGAGPAGKGWRVTLAQMNASSCEPLTGQSVQAGKSSPFQGWVSPSYLKRTPAPTVISPPAGAVLSVIVPGAADPEITCTGGKVTVRTPSGPVSFTVPAPGELR